MSHDDQDWDDALDAPPEPDLTTIRRPKGVTTPKLEVPDSPSAITPPVRTSTDTDKTYHTKFVRWATAHSIKQAAISKSLRIFADTDLKWQAKNIKEPRTPVLVQMPTSLKLRLGHFLVDAFGGKENLRTAVILEAVDEFLRREGY